MQAGETALQSLAKRLTHEDETLLMEGIQKAEIIVAVKTGDLSYLRQLVECQGCDVNVKDHVRRTWIRFYSYLFFIYDTVSERRERIGPRCKKRRSHHV